MLVDSAACHQKLILAYKDIYNARMVKSLDYKWRDTYNDTTMVAKYDLEIKYE